MERSILANFALNYHLNSLSESYATLFSKDPTVVHLLFTATCSLMNSPVNQTNRCFHGFLFDSAEITLLKQLFASGSVNIVE